MLDKTVWALDYICDQDCDFCYDYGSGIRYPLETYYEMADKTRELGTKKYIFGGGESFLFPYRNELLGYTAENGARNVFVTNGRHNSPQNLMPLQGKANQIRSSIHSHDPEWLAAHKIYQRGETPVQYDGLVWGGLRQVNEHGFENATTSVLIDQTEKDLHNLAERFSDLGIIEWTLQQYSMIRGQAANNPDYHKVALERFDNILYNLQNAGYPLEIVGNSDIRLGNEYEAIDTYGNLNVIRDGKEIIIGNMATDPVEQLRAGLEQHKGRHQQ